jgi:hypothetical protein
MRCEPNELDDLRADYDTARAEHHLLREYEHTEEGSYWAWVEHIATQMGLVH